VEIKIRKSKKAQEEMVGFALIIIIVAVILLIFLGFSLRNGEKEAVESYEVESFLQIFLQYTTDCRDNLESLSVQKLINDCRKENTCLDGRKSCDVLNETLKEIVEKSWKVENGSSVKGYNLRISSNEEEMINLNKGNQTFSSKGAIQYLSGDTEISFKAYY